VSDPLDLYEHLARLDRLQVDADRQRREMGRELRAELHRAVVGTPIIVAFILRWNGVRAFRSVAIAMSDDQIRCWLEESDKRAADHRAQMARAERFNRRFNVALLILYATAVAELLAAVWLLYRIAVKVGAL
jgi:hypothetical protein